MDLSTCLKELLANEVTMYLKAHGAHWNVEGILFSQYHDFFEAIYTDVYSSIDPTAENIRKLGDFAPFTLPELNKLSKVADQKTKPTAIELVKDLHEANETLIDCIDTCSEAATEEGEWGIANFLAERDDMHKKWRWQLEASMKG